MEQTASAGLVAETVTRVECLDEPCQERFQRCHQQFHHCAPKERWHWTASPREAPEAMANRVKGPAKHYGWRRRNRQLSEKCSSSRKSFGIKASAKCMNVNVHNVAPFTSSRPETWTILERKVKLKSWVLPQPCVVFIKDRAWLLKMEVIFL